MKHCSAVLWLLLVLPMINGAGRPAEEVPRDELVIDLENRTITFSAEVRQTSGHVQFLIHTRGYEWLKEESALSADIHLKDLQLAAAQLNWRHFDDLWFSNREVYEVTVFIEWNGIIRCSGELVKDPGTPDAGRLIFWGSPYFDHIALTAGTAADCSTCPIFPLEQALIREAFPQGLVLEESRMPPAGSRVTVIVEVGQ